MSTNYFQGHHASFDFCYERAELHAARADVESSRTVPVKNNRFRSNAHMPVHTYVHLDPDILDLYLAS